MGGRVKVGWFIKHGAMVPLSSQEFQAGMRQRFAERDEMFFLEAQVSQYEKDRSRFQQQPQMELFVSDERSAIEFGESQSVSIPRMEVNP